EPRAEPQFATVTSNDDPMGRVQVRFDWQGGGDSTEWIRVLTPDAGSSGKVSKNRGFVFIPEVGDQVMAGFVHGHPDRPYVMGGLFHGKIGAGGYQQNHLKTITTRSGCIIQIDDTENEGSITIKDPSGNTWYMDGAGNINVNAPKNFTVNAGENVTITAGMNITSSAGVNISESAGMNHSSSAGAMMIQNAAADYSLMATNITEIAQGEKKSKAKDINESAENKEVAVQGNNNWHTQGEFNNHSGENSKSH
ncbi:MAG TPA: phage baseplate assembly protein V, partial [Flavobacterium sp.]|nr:phage baseplate assembly protein V [Flavobacterium sp.]